MAYRQQAGNWSDIPVKYAFIYICALVKKKIKFSLIYKEIQSGAVANSYMRKGLPSIWGNAQIFPHIVYIRRPLVIYDFATSPFWISLYMRKIWFSFFQCISVFPLYLLVTLNLSVFPLYPPSVFFLLKEELRGASSCRFCTSYLKRPSGQIRSAGEQYHLVALGLVVYRYMFYIYFILILNFSSEFKVLSCFIKNAFIPPILIGGRLVCGQAQGVYN